MKLLSSFSVALFVTFTLSCIKIGSTQDCNITWIKYDNSNFRNAYRASVQDTVVKCKIECIGTPGCLAVDVDMTYAQQYYICWFHIDPLDLISNFSYDKVDAYKKVGCPSETGQGRTGPVGPVGPVGPIGPVGPVGPAGREGQMGQLGAMGTTGLIGLPGVMGATGFTGVMGPQGITGLNGQPGATGLIGYTGQTGPKGIIGDPGAPGPPGPQGPAGLPALTGPSAALHALKSSSNDNEEIYKKLEELDQKFQQLHNQQWFYPTVISPAVTIVTVLICFAIFFFLKKVFKNRCQTEEDKVDKGERHWDSQSANSVDDKTTIVGY